MANKQLGSIALIGAPVMFIGVITEFLFPALQDSWFTGVWGIIYITAWMCSLVVLQRMEVAGDGFGKWLIRLMFFTLTVANLSNFIRLFAGKDVPWYFFQIDLFWPLSHALMLVLAITVLFFNKVSRASKLILVAAGLWLPIALTLLALFGKTLPVLFIPGLYHAIMWSLMALIARRQPDIPESSGILKRKKGHRLTTLPVNSINY